MTPNLAYVHVRNPYWRGFGLWLPLFLLWIPALLLAPLVLLVVFVVCVANRISPWRAIAAFWAILSALRGTDVNVHTGQNLVHVRLI